MKKCNKCGEEKQLSEFHVDRTKKDGRKTICKECRSNKKIKIKVTNERRKFDRNLHSSIYRAIKENKSGRMWERIVGYTLQNLKDHLELQFDENMNWENFGSYWWIDRIIPKSAYKYSNAENNELKKCWCLKNSRPLNKNECVRKKDKVIWSLIEEYSLFDILPLGLLIIEEDE